MTLSIKPFDPKHFSVSGNIVHIVVEITRLFLRVHTKEASQNICWFYIQSDNKRIFEDFEVKIQHYSEKFNEIDIKVNIFKNIFIMIKILKKSNKIYY